jgi:hypothetical protein
VAVTLQLDDLVSPKGELLPSMFPAGNIDELVDTWLEQASAATSSDAAARHMIYYRAYTHVANRLAGMDASRSSGGEVSASVSPGQISHFRTKAEQNLSEYNRLTKTESFEALKQVRVVVA